MVFAWLLLIFLLGIFLVKKFQPQNSPPGPWGLPFLGHLVSLGLNPHLTLMKWKQKYGPIIQVRFGSFPTVVLGDSKMTKEAFNMLEFAGRPGIQVYVQNNGTKGIGMSEGSYNTELRQFTIRKLKEFGMGRKSLECQILEGISEFMDFIKKREKLPIKSEEIPSSHIVKSLWSIMMTEELNPEETERLAQRINGITQLGPVLSELAGFMPWMENLTRFLTFGHFSLISFRSNKMKEYFAFFAKALEEKKQKGTRDGNQNDIMSFYLGKVEETRNESSPFHASHKSSTVYLADVLAGAIHTMHTNLLWLFNYMAKNPEVQLKLQKEIDEVIGNGNDLSRLPSLSDRGQMLYADAVIHEVLRISPTFPLGMPHKTTKDVRFHGYEIKKDTMVFSNLYGIQHDPEIWGDPENFRPKRWLGDFGKKLKSEHFLVFSTGRRNCVGDAFAREQLFLYVTALFQKYRVGFHGNAKDVKTIFGISLHPSKFTVVFNKRKVNKS